MARQGEVRAAVKALQDQLRPDDFLTDTSFGRRLFLGGGRAGRRADCRISLLLARLGCLQLSLLLQAPSRKSPPQFKPGSPCGPGKGAILTQCVVDVMQALTQLSLMGIAIDTLANVPRLECFAVITSSCTTIKADCDNPSVGSTMAVSIGCSVQIALRVEDCNLKRFVDQPRSDNYGLTQVSPKKTRER